MAVKLRVVGEDDRFESLEIVREIRSYRHALIPVAAVSRMTGWSVRKINDMRNDGRLVKLPGGVDKADLLRHLRETCRL